MASAVAPEHSYEDLAVELVRRWKGADLVPHSFFLYVDAPGHRGPIFKPQNTSDADKFTMVTICHVCLHVHTGKREEGQLLSNVNKHISLKQEGSLKVKSCRNVGQRKTVVKKEPVDDSFPDPHPVEGPEAQADAVPSAVKPKDDDLGPVDDKAVAAASSAAPDVGACAGEDPMAESSLDVKGTDATSITLSLPELPLHLQHLAPGFVVYAAQLLAKSHFAADQEALGASRELISLLMPVVFGDVNVFEYAAKIGSLVQAEAEKKGAECQAAKVGSPKPLADDDEASETDSAEDSPCLVKVGDFPHSPAWSNSGHSPARSESPESDASDEMHLSIVKMEEVEADPVSPSDDFVSWDGLE